LFYDSLFICAEHHEASLFGPSRVIALIAFTSNKNSTSDSQPIVIGLDTDEKVEEAKKGLKPIQAG
jgi:hypothetical protein